MISISYLRAYLRRWLTGALTLTLLACLSGCATGSHPKDPLEHFNRAVFNFNDAVDKTALKPAATAYRSLLPSFLQTAIGNFFGNIGDAWTAINSLLQGKIENGMSDITRVAMNTTFGLGGLLDIGSEAGLQKHSEDFGQTLGKWGVKPGPYVMLPLLGPSTLRDTVALPVDYAGDPWGRKYPIRQRNIGSVVRALDQRAALLDATNLIEEAALDKYEFVRDGYLQRRESRINDGGPSKSKDDEYSLEQAPVSIAAAPESAEPVAVAKPLADVDVDAKPDAAAANTANPPVLSSESATK